MPLLRRMCCKLGKNTQQKSFKRAGAEQSATVEELYSQIKMDLKDVNFEDLFQFSPDPPNPEQEEHIENQIKKNKRMDSYSSEYTLPQGSFIK